MNINSLIKNFQTYLISLESENDKEYDIDSPLSIYKYADEFKTFVADELNVSDVSIFSKSVNDILEMEVVDGKLVDKTEENTDTFIKSEETETETPTENKSEKSQQNDISVIINNLLSDENVIKALDSDGDTALNEEEIETFLGAINSIDGDIKNLSIDDILGGIEHIKNGTYVNGELLEEIPEEEIDDIEDTTTEEVNNNVASTPTSGVSSGGGSYSPSSNGGTNTPQEKTLENMSKSELNTELQKAEGELSTKKDELSALLDGSNSELKAMDENIEKLYETYSTELKKVDKDMAEQVDTLKESIDKKEDEIDKKDQEIIDQESSVSESENAYNNAVSNREALEATLSILEGTDTSKMEDAKKNELSTKISNLKSEIKKAEQAEKDAKTKWDDAKEKLDNLNKEKDVLQKDLDKLNEDMTKLENEIAKKYPEVKESLDKYNEAKEKRAEYKSENVEKIKAEIATAQEYVNEVNTAISKAETKEKTSEYGIGVSGDKIVEFAKSFLDASESNNLADKFVQQYGSGYDSSSTPWCAAFVEYVLKNSGEYDSVPDWYKKANGGYDQPKWGCTAILNSAPQEARVNPSDAKAGDLILFDWDNSGGNASDHIGFVVSVENGKVTTIEGNTSDKVAYRTYDINDPDIKAILDLNQG